MRYDFLINMVLEKLMECENEIWAEVITNLDKN